LVKAGYAAQEKALRLVFPELIHVHLLPRGTKVSLGFKMVRKGTEKIGALFIEQTPFTKWCADKGIALPTLEEPH
jgi:hypothetical protein